MDISRRDLLRAGIAAGALTALSPATRALAANKHPRPPVIRQPDSLPDPSRPMGTADPSMPFDHVVCLMMENHSFDNYFGMLAQRGQPKADGFTFDALGRPTNSNLDKNGRVVRAFKLDDGCQGGAVSQNWD